MKRNGPTAGGAVAPSGSVVLAKSRLRRYSESESPGTAELAHARRGLLARTCRFRLLHGSNFRRFALSLLCSLDTRPQRSHEVDRGSGDGGFGRRNVLVPFQLRLDDRLQRCAVFILVLRRV